ncbi:MAG: ABC transporter permease [Anaerolineae bacterium]|nr:ABC transporter permease [Anaerolineae bacterium]
MGGLWQVRLRWTPLTLVSLLMVALYVTLAVAGPWLAPYPYTEQHLSATLQPPSAHYLFGTDQFGRDILSRVIVGSRDILLLATLATVLTLLLGIAIGLTAGYLGGWWEELLMRASDVLLSFPALLLALLILSMLGSDLVYLVLCLGIVFAPGHARTVHSVTLGLKTQEFVAAARLRGESALYIMTQEILPNAVGPIVVDACLYFTYAILVGSSLGFLGLGLQPPSPDWGLQISDGRALVLTAPWVVMFPSLAIASLVVAVNSVADSLASAFDATTTED